uniref:Uncharacterized protein n=1 Tax=Oryza meridionalis TaxID=40149 RepID=A0A0E0F4G2_9ORYZ
MAGVNNSLVGLKPAAAVPQTAASPALPKRVRVAAPLKLEQQGGGRRAALLGLAAMFAATAAGQAGQARAGVFDECLEKRKANKEQNDKKRLATSGANFARAYTVEFGSCHRRLGPAAGHSRAWRRRRRRLFPCRLAAAAPPSSNRAVAGYAAALADASLRAWDAAKGRPPRARASRLGRRRRRHC